MVGALVGAHVCAAMAAIATATGAAAMRGGLHEVRGTDKP